MGLGRIEYIALFKRADDRAWQALNGVKSGFDAHATSIGEKTNDENPPFLWLRTPRSTNEAHDVSLARCVEVSTFRDLYLSSCADRALCDSHCLYSMPHVARASPCAFLLL